MNLKIESHTADGVAVVSCQGRIVVGEEASALRQEVKHILPANGKIVLNLAGVTYIDSTGLGTLVGIYSSARSAGGDIKLCGLGHRFRDVLQITKLATVFEVYESEQQAVEAFSGGKG
ncbi:MAG TPA: STAS domain-containing protein [Terriglobales bacterium]|nr:STAS domain-containing protein [Terriglobales bacterium]